MNEQLSLSHIAIPAEDPEKLRKWYCDNLKLKAHGSHLWSGGSVIAIIKGKPLPNDDWHFGFRLSSKAALREWLQHFQELGIQVNGPNGSERYESFYVRDPEGNDIEFFFEEPPEG